MPGLSGITDRIGVCTKPFGFESPAREGRAGDGAAAGRAAGCAARACGGAAAAGVRREQTPIHARWATNPAAVPAAEGKSQGAAASATDTSASGLNARDPW